MAGRISSTAAAIAFVLIPLAAGFDLRCSLRHHRIRAAPARGTDEGYGYRSDTENRAVLVAAGRAKGTDEDGGILRLRSICNDTGSGSGARSYTGRAGAGGAKCFMMPRM